MELVNVPAVVADGLRESLENLLDDSELADVSIVWCDRADDWEEVRRVGLDGGSPVVLARESSAHDWSIALAWGAPMVLQSASVDVVAEAIRRMHRGSLCVPIAAARTVGDAARDVLDPVSGLTEVDRRLLVQLSAPGRLVDIAEVMGYSERTIRRKTRLLFEKLGVTGREAAIQRASELGVIG